MKNYRKVSLFILAGLLCVMVLSANALAAQAARSSKALRVKTAYTVQKGEHDWLKNTYIADVQLPKTGKLTMSQTMSAKVVIPEKLIANEGDNLEAALSLGLYQGERRKSGVDASYWIELTRKNGKILLQKREMKTDSRSPAGKYASLTKKKGNYILTIKNVPVNGNASLDDKPISFDSLVSKKKSFTLHLQFALIGNVTKKTGNQYFYLDEISLKTTGTKKVTFDSAKEYVSWETLRFDGKTVASKITVL